MQEKICHPESTTNHVVNEGSMRFFGFTSE